MIFVLLPVFFVLLTAHDYCIIGAGPGGLQMSRFLHGRDYICFEKEKSAGNFFSKFPRGRELISINKRYTGKSSDSSFSMRHDWNSLLGGEESFRNYSTSFYPHADDLVRYLQSYSKGLNIQYNTEIKHIQRLSNGTFLLNHVYRCQKSLLIATGYSKAYIPTGMMGKELAEHYQDIEWNASQFRNQSVLIVGNGNSAFDVADLITSETAYIHIGSTSHITLSYYTHYVGNVRAKNNKFLDHYQLKSLDGLLLFNASEATLYKRADGKIGVYMRDPSEEFDEGILEQFEEEQTEGLDPHREGYDRVILTSGWENDRSLFSQGNVKPRFGKKFPVTTNLYESVNEANVWFLGAMMHGLDWKKSAGGFIHGFRYLIKATHATLMNRYEGQEFPNTLVKGGRNGLLEYLLRRVQNVDGHYQMFSIIGDVVILEGKEKAKDDEFRVYEDVLLNNLFEYDFVKSSKRILAWKFDYGIYHEGPGVLFEQVAGPEHPQESGFLHPIFTEYESNTGKVLSNLHLPEDFLTLFDSTTHHLEPLSGYLLRIQKGLKSFEPPPEVLHPAFFETGRRAPKQRLEMDRAAHKISQLAETLLTFGKFEDAAKTMEVAMSVWSEVYGDRCSKIVPMKIFLAFANFKLGKLDVSRALMKEARELAEIIFDPHSVESYVTYYMLQSCSYYTFEDEKKYGSPKSKEGLRDERFKLFSSAMKMSVSREHKFNVIQKFEL